MHWLSHNRPDNVFKDNTCPIIGTADFGILLVSANEEGLGQLRQRVQSRAKTVQLDIAAIEEISVFSSEDRLQVNCLDDNDFGVQKYKVHLFDHLKDKTECCC